MTELHISKCLAAHTGATVYRSAHENASWLRKVALTGLALDVYDGMSLYVTTSDYFCYSH